MPPTARKAEWSGARREAEAIEETRSSRGLRAGAGTAGIDSLKGIDAMLQLLGQIWPRGIDASE